MVHLCLFISNEKVLGETSECHSHILRSKAQFGLIYRLWCLRKQWILLARHCSCTLWYSVSIKPIHAGWPLSRKCFFLEMSPGCRVNQWIFIMQVYNTIAKLIGKTVFLATVHHNTITQDCQEQKTVQSDTMSWMEQLLLNIWRDRLAF